MPLIKSNTYSCAVTPTDKVLAYVTDVEQHGGSELFALVATNAQGQKISVLLTTKQAEDLHAQLNDWCFGVTEE